MGRRAIALALPEVSERPAYGNTAWRVRDKIFVWERPLRPKEATPHFDGYAAVLIRLDRISAEELGERRSPASFSRYSLASRFGALHSQASTISSTRRAAWRP